MTLVRTSIDDLAHLLVDAFHPRTALHVGCDDGSLVRALREQGVRADGLHVTGVTGPPASHPFCRTASPEGPFGADYDLVVCLGALEHLPVDARQSAVAALSRAGSVIVFRPMSGEASDGDCSLRLLSWLQLFADVGFHLEVAGDRWRAIPGTVTLRRIHMPLTVIAAEYAWEIVRRGWNSWNGATPAANDNNGSRLALEELERLARDLSLAQSLLVEARAELEASEARRAAAEARLAAVTSGGTFATAELLRRVVRRVAPTGTRRARAVARAGAVLTRLTRRQATPASSAAVVPAPSNLDDEYRMWLARNRPSEEALAAMGREVRSWSDRPLVSVVVPVHDPEPVWLAEAVASVRAQVYDRWELCLVDDASTRADVQALLEELATDPRIRLRRRPGNGGIAVATNDALAMATGEWIAFLDHDDLLEPHALAAVMLRVREAPDTDLVYTDEDKLLLDGRRGQVFFKPDWSPDLLLSTNYVCHLMVVRRRLLFEVGGLREGFDGSQDHDLVLRATERARRIEHVPLPLYTWRQTPGSTATAATAKPYAHLNGMRAVSEALARRGIEGRVDPGPSPGRYHVRYAIRGRPRVCVVVPTRDRADLLAACLAGVERDGYPFLEVVVVDNDSRDPTTLAWLARCGHRVVRQPGPFNFSRLVNAGVAASDAEHVLLLNNDVEATTPGWIEAMLEHSQRPDVGAVGARLLDPDGRVLHEGDAVGIGGPASHIDTRGYIDLGAVIRDVGAVTAACMMVRREVWQRLGGFDEELHVAYNDVDFCLRARRAGYRIVYTPLATLVHREGQSRGRLNPDGDVRRFLARWRDELRDPFVSPHFAAVNPLRLRVD